MTCFGLSVQLGLRHIWRFRVVRTRFHATNGGSSVPPRRLAAKCGPVSSLNHLGIIWERADKRPSKQITACELQPHDPKRVHPERIATVDGQPSDCSAEWTCRQGCIPPWFSVRRALPRLSGGSRGLRTRGGARSRPGRLRKRSDLHGAARAGATTRARRPSMRSRRHGLSQNHPRLSSRRAGQRRRAGPKPTFIRWSGAGNITAHARRSSTSPRSGRRGAGANRRRCPTRTWPTTSKKKST